MQLPSRKFDILSVGAGAAGIAAACSAAKAGCSVLLAEQEEDIGGVLRRCIHHGFGLGYFGEDMTGPEYLERLRKHLENSPVTVETGACILSVGTDKTALLSSVKGLERIEFRELVLSTGCRERPLYALPVAGTRPSGIFTAGEAQEMINIGHMDIGSRFVILGSGDIGQIVARRLRILGKEVAAMVEIRDTPGGMARNRRECIEAYRIPLMLNSTVVEVLGYPRLTGVRIRHFDTGEEEILPCDTLITSLGLIPDKDLVRPLLHDGAYPGWVHFCGNADSVHEIVDSVSRQGEQLGRQLAEELKAKR